MNDIPGRMLVHWKAGIGFAYGAMATVLALACAPSTTFSTAALAANSGKGETSGTRWASYTNARYGVAVDYPENTFRKEEAPTNNAGRSFSGSNGSRFFVYSSANALDQPLSAMLQEALSDVAPADIVARVKRRNGFTVAFRREGKIVHRHLLTSEDNSFLHWLEISYPEDQRQRFVPIVARMIGSFRVDADVKPL